ncbi:MAG TPA: outer membrane beta-barrel protein [Candidatus Eisenbacteria bacterium]|nr:outer membrane beta-barrel protein [Candidatus Eisenbacteria bacterium]
MASRTDIAHALRAGLLALVLLAAPRFAAAAPAWGGMWWSLGGAYSSTKADCRDCEEQEYVDTGSFIGRVGYAVSPRVRLGGEYTRTFRQQTGPDATLSTVSAVAQWNMVRAVPIIIEVGYGISRASYSVEENGNVVGIHRNGIALNLGVGSEWPIGPVAIGPYGAMYVGGLGDVQTPTTVARDVLVLSWFAGLQVTMP